MVTDLSQRFAGALVCLVFLFCMTAYARAESSVERAALVIGIDAYQNVATLQKAGNDARGVAKALDSLGFDVALHIDVDRRALLGAISAFAAGLNEGDEALVYFAGHGVELEGRNYILAADVPALASGDEAFLAGEGIAVDAVLDSLTSRGVAITTLILDACRNNPFEQKGTRSLGSSRGLAPLVAPEGAFILYSASQGEAALDRLSDGDTDPNSVFTRVLLTLLDQPGLPIHVLARTLRQEVQSIAATARHNQRPAYYDEVNGDYVLNRMPSATGQVANEAKPAIVLPTNPEPVGPAADPVAPRTNEEIIRATQAELVRIGCNAGVPDGVSGRRTKTALDLYAMVKGWTTLPGSIGSDALLSALEVETARVCASNWIASRVPMALSGDWVFSMRCPNGLGADGSALLAVDASGRVQGAVTNQSGNTRELAGSIADGKFSGEIDGGTDKPLRFDLGLSDYETRMEGTDAFGCLQTYQR